MLDIPAEPCIGQLEIPFDLEDVRKIYGGWSRERNNHLYHQIPHPLTNTKGLRLVTDAESPSTR